MGEKTKFERVRVFRDRKWYLVDDVEGAIDIVQSSPKIIRRHLDRLQAVLFAAIESQDRADIAAARQAFVTAMRTEGWLH